MPFTGWAVVAPSYDATDRLEPVLCTGAQSFASRCDRGTRPLLVAWCPGIELQADSYGYGVTSGIKFSLWAVRSAEESTRSQKNLSKTRAAETQCIGHRLS
ncbi:MAG: hypothetical protein RL033_8020 [Pseudomonadota bacterium]|jgi:hypothetical protein